MRMELIQPFINAADAVFAESLQAPTNILDLTMESETYRRKGVAAMIAIKGDIEGRIILDLAPEVAMKVASQLAGAPVQENEQVVRETVCELANLPKLAFPTVSAALVGLDRLKVGVLVRLKASVRNSTRVPSEGLKLLNSERSNCCNEGPVT